MLISPRLRAGRWFAAARFVTVRKVWNNQTHQSRQRPLPMSVNLINYWLNYFHVMSWILSCFVIDLWSAAWPGSVCLWDSTLLTFDSISTASGSGVCLQDFTCPPACAILDLGRPDLIRHIQTICNLHWQFEFVSQCLSFEFVIINQMSSLCSFLRFGLPGMHRQRWSIVQHVSPAQRQCAEHSRSIKSNAYYKPHGKSKINVL